MIHLQTIIKTAKHVLTANGAHSPQLILFTKDGDNQAALIQELPEQKQAQLAMFLNLGARMGQTANAGELDETYFISEAWLGNEEELAQGISAKDQKNKREVVIIVGRKATTNQTVSYIIDLIRNEQGELVGLADGDAKSDWKINNMLLHAFEYGYLHTFKKKTE